MSSVEKEEDSPLELLGEHFRNPPHKAHTTDMPERLKESNKVG